MDPITLATITSAVTVVATEAGKGVMAGVGQDVWARIKGVLGLQKDPPPAELAPTIATRLEHDDEAAREVLRLLREHADASPKAAAIVGQINAEKVVIIPNQTVHGDFNLQL